MATKLRLESTKAHCECFVYLKKHSTLNLPMLSFLRLKLAPQKFNQLHSQSLAVCGINFHVLDNARRRENETRRLYLPRHCEQSEAIQTARQRAGLPRRFAPRKDERWEPHVKNPAVYIMASKRNGTLYTGVTSNLPQRAWQHREGVMKGFASKNECKMLVWFSIFATMDAAIAEEKRIKGGSRKKKLMLIEGLNPNWRDLFEELAH
jgi:putative endonuclease